MRRATLDTWQVYRIDNPLREPGTVVGTTGPLAGSVASWEDLKALAAREGVQSHQIDGEGLTEMQDQFGPMSE